MTTKFRVLIVAVAIAASAVGSFLGSASAIDNATYNKLAIEALLTFGLCWVACLVLLTKGQNWERLLGLVIGLSVIPVLLDIIQRWNFLFGTGG